MDAELRAQHIADSTAIIVSAKHGQSPQDPNALTRIDDGPIVDGDQRRVGRGASRRR